MPHRPSPLALEDDAARLHGFEITETISDIQRLKREAHQPVCRRPRDRRLLYIPLKHQREPVSRQRQRDPAAIAERGIFDDLEPTLVATEWPRRNPSPTNSRSSRLACVFLLTCQRVRELRTRPGCRGMVVTALAGSAVARPLLRLNFFCCTSIAMRETRSGFSWSVGLQRAPDQARPVFEAAAVLPSTQLLAADL